MSASACTRCVMAGWQSNPYIDDEAEDEDDGSEESEKDDEVADDELSDGDNVEDTEADDDDADSLHLHLDTEDVEDTQCMSIFLLFQSNVNVP